MDTRHIRTLLITALLFKLCIAQATISLPDDAIVSSQQATPEQQRQLGSLDLPFIENRGQMDARVAYYARTFAGAAFITHDGELVLSLPGKPRKTSHDSKPGTIKTRQEHEAGWVLTEKPVSSFKARARGAGEGASRVSVFHGKDRKQWQQGLKTYAAVELGQPWPGIDYEVRAHGSNIERVFTVSPGVKADAIRMQVGGVRGLRLQQGLLVADTGNGPVRLSRPIAYQDINGVRKDVQVAYHLDGKHYGFTLGDYDREHALIIDPLIQSTYLGGTQADIVYAMSLSDSGDVYVAGHTGSSDFPGVTGGAQTNYVANFEPFVAKLSADLSSLTQATYLGGAGYESIFNLALDGNGDVYVTGITDSTDFPGTTGSAQASNSGLNDGFVAKLSADLTTLIQSTYLGGMENDYAYHLALGSSGQVYVTGGTGSTDFPSTAGGAQTSMNGSGAIFVAMLNADLTTVMQATYLGGTENEGVSTLAIGASGEVYLAGDTTSADFPGTVGGAQVATGGMTDMFVAMLSADLTALKQATYLGGAGPDYTVTMALGSSGQVYVAGSTAFADFPGTAGGAQVSNGGNYDAFVAVLSVDLTGLTQATYLGGADFDEARRLAIGGNGEVYVTGDTRSTDFPGTTSGAQASYGGGSEDSFVALLSADLTDLTQATYLGGTSGENVQALALGSSGQVYVAGSTKSTDFPATAGGAQVSFGGIMDAFVAMIDSLSLFAVPVIDGLADLTVNSGQETTESLTITGEGSLMVTVTSSNQTLLPDVNIAGVNACTLSGDCVLTLVSADGETGTATLTITLSDTHGQQVTSSFTVTVATPVTAPVTTTTGGGGTGGAIGQLVLVLLPLIITLRRRVLGYWGNGS